ncbi:MAG TPA: substrate-binding and VWA domain-containing protein [Jiangellales bacterium]|nr:substrate-binding and VWA domain-containing protein [Jiangellales bacterium]
MALALVAAGVAFAYARLVPPDGVASGRDCSGSLPVRVAAAPAIAPTVEQMAERFVRGAPSVDGTCVRVDVEAVSSNEAAAAMSVDAAAAPALWVPDSALWASRVAADGLSVQDEGSLASTPLVVVAPRDIASSLGWPEAAVSWAALLDSAGTATVADPTTTTEGLATLLAVRAATAAEPEAQQRVVAAMVEVARQAVPDVGAAFQQVVADPAAAPVFTATEQQLLAHNREHPDAPVVALYPGEGTLMLDYPALRTARPGDPPALDEAVGGLLELLRSPEATSLLQAAGFRTPEGQASPTSGITDGIVAAAPATLPLPDGDEVAGLLRQWAAVSLEFRMLAVIDVSGSMRERVEGGATRIELARDAAKTALGLFPDSASIGMWAFSIAQDPPRDYVELVPLGPITDDVGGTSRRDLLVGAADSLPERAQGGTGLYDTALAAFRTVRAGYEPGKVNSVVLLTDGRNEDDPDSITLEGLLTTLQAESDPAQPVPVIAIGMSPDADIDALRQIAAATGGEAYLAADPRDIQQVFLDAMVARQCRPNCG